MRVPSLIAVLLCLTGIPAVHADADPGVTDANAVLGEIPLLPEPTWEPEPFDTRYRVRYEGVPFAATGTRTLERIENGEFQFESKVSAFMVRLEEDSRFSQDEDGTLRAQEYHYRRSGLAGNRNRVAHFDWSVPRVVRTGDKEQERDLDGLVYDPVSWQLALQRDLSRGGYSIGDVYSYAVTNGGEPDDYRLVVTDTPAISVPAGDFNTVLLEREHDPDGGRETRIWVSPEHNYLLVRLEHTDGRKLTLALEEIRH